MKSRFFFITIFLIMIFSNIYADDALKDIIDSSIRYENWNDAKSRLEIYISANGTDPYALSLYSIVLKELGLFDEAISAATKAINYEKSDHERGEIYYNLGTIYYKKQLTELASKMFDKAISYNAIIAAPYYMKGVISYNEEDYKSCIEDWQKYLILSTDKAKKIKVQEAIDKLRTYQKELEDKKQQAEELRNSLLDDLLDDLSTSDDSTSMEDYKVDVDSSEEHFEEID